MGPVYVCLPADVLDSPVVEEVLPTFIPSTRVVPDDSFIKAAAAMLASAHQPMIFMGDGVSYSGASAELAELAEALGAEVWGVDSGELNLSYSHPLYQGQTGHMFGEASYPITSKGDVNFVVGTYMVPEVFPNLGDIYGEGAKVIHVDLNAYEIAKNHRVDLGVVSDPKLTMARLVEALAAMMTTDQKAAAQKRLAGLQAAKEKKVAAQIAADEAKRNNVPMAPAAFMAELAKQAPADVIIWDEALTSSPALTRYLPPTHPGHFFQTRGGSLGVGVPGALAAKLANPDKTVIGFSGDGGSMYTIQALWTAAHHRIGAKFCICNNQSYMLLKLNIQQYWKTQNIEGDDFPQPFELLDPVIDFVTIAKSMGVPGLKVTTPAEIEGAIKQMLAHDGPVLIDLVISNEVPA
jgi:benzoylformate decarboxylase